MSSEGKLSMPRAVAVSLIILSMSCASPHRNSESDGGIGNPNPNDPDMATQPPIGMTCAPDKADLVGCACTPGSTHACWTGAASARGVGACKDGSQSCPQTELATYGPCTGAVLPTTENCTNGIDDDCNGKTDCADPACATNSACTCHAGTLQWTFSFDGWPKTYNPTLGPKDKLVSVASITGSFCWDQNGNCHPCDSFYGTLAANGKSYYVGYGDYDNDNSGSCTFNFNTLICP